MGITVLVFLSSIFFFSNYIAGIEFLSVIVSEGDEWELLFLVFRFSIYFTAGAGVY